jgi:hypothetical protein
VFIWYAGGVRKWRVKLLAKANAPVELCVEFHLNRS